MNKLPVILIFDIGKTNKKLLLFDEQYKIVYEETMQLEETTDEDGFACEDVHALTQWVKNSFEAITKDKRFAIKAINFSAYGASFVCLDKKGKIIAPLYNYLKPYPENLKQQFYNNYGGESLVANETASPVLGNLNSGMQLYQLKYEKPQLFAQIKYALHLPQYISFILSSKLYSDITSIGCHTHLWDFQQNKYHHWVQQEGIEPKLLPVLGCEAVTGYVNETIPVGVGLHDSSAALIPYQASFNGPFILLSTGTWCISLNPFNHSPLTGDELQYDCLCYLSYKGTPVKASRLFAGYEHEQQVKRLSEYFHKADNYFTSIVFNEKFLNRHQPFGKTDITGNTAMMNPSLFSARDIHAFASYEEAYHQLIEDIINEQVHSTKLVMNENVKRIFVDGGFSKNPVYMHLLAKSFPGIEVYAATVAQASSLGAALAIHHHWNTQRVPDSVVDLKQY